MRSHQPCGLPAVCCGGANLIVCSLPLICLASSSVLEFRMAPFCTADRRGVETFPKVCFDHRMPAESLSDFSFSSFGAFGLVRL